MSPGQRIMGLGCVVAVVLLLSWTFNHPDHYLAVRSRLKDAVLRQNCEPGYLRGPPTASFRDNLRGDKRYITSWPINGMTNSIMAYMSWLYIAHLTGRIAILPPFTPLHIGTDKPPLPVSAVFDLLRLTAESGVAAVDWRDVKQLEGGAVASDEIGCWSAHIIRGGQPAHTVTEDQLGLDVAYTSVPRRALAMDDKNPSVLNLHILYALDFNRTRSLFLQESRERAFPNRMGNLPPPDVHLMCFDFLYDVATSVHYEWDYEWTPMWTHLGRYMHFTAHVEDLTTQAIRRAFDLPPSGPLPPQFIAVHVRHGDFEDACERPLAECFAPLSDYAKRIRQVQVELNNTLGIVPTRVLVASDERDPAWWAEVQGLGWAHIDFTQMDDPVLGSWLPIVVDSAAMSMAHGFVGTERSTVTMMAARRVRAWQGGAVRKVNWSYQGADDHFEWKGTAYTYIGGLTLGMAAAGPGRHG